MHQLRSRAAKTPWRGSARSSQIGRSSLGFGPFVAPMSSRGDGQSRMWKTLAKRRAHAPLPLPAGHARMPPGRRASVTEVLRLRGFPGPISVLFTETPLNCLIALQRQGRMCDTPACRCIIHHKLVARRRLFIELNGLDELTLSYHLGSGGSYDEREGS